MGGAALSGRPETQAFSVSEPVPFGVLMVVQVPFGTYFHALPW